MISHIAFDIGNVLCNMDIEVFLKSLSITLNISKEKAFEFLYRNQKPHDLGMNTMKEALKDSFDIKSEYMLQDLLYSWNKTIWANRDMFDLLGKLENQNVKIALLSNIGFDHKEYLCKILQYEKGFNNSIKFFSCEVGARKPTLLYCQSFLMQYPEFKNCIYIDDLQENLDTGKLVGFNTYRFSLANNDKIDDLSKYIESY